MIFDPEQITFFAKTDARGMHVPFGIKAKDRTRHMYVIGKTGMGKSTLLENMAVQDIRNGNGLAFIDPHGQTAETLLNYIPEERKSDVLYFAPFDTQYPVSFNVMEDVGPDRRHLVVSGLMSVFKKIWIDAWSARMEYILSNTLLALLEYPDSTLLGVNRMLSDKDYRKKVIDNIKDPSVRSFWVDEFMKYNERYMQEAGDAIKNKIGQFTNNPLIRNIVGQPHSSFDIRTIMDQKKIIIMNLSKGLVGESNANLLGSMLTTRIYLAAMSRADLLADQMAQAPNFYFYVDEFQSFANATFADILSEARKYKLNLTIAHQYIEQMEEEVKNAVFGNVGTIVAFRVGPFDAEVLETIFSPKFLATDIVNLGFAQVYLTLMIDGIGSSPFSATTLPPIPAASISYRDVIVGESRRQFARERAEVEQQILDFHQPVGAANERKPKIEIEQRTTPAQPEIQRERPPQERTANTRSSRPQDEARPVTSPTNPQRGERVSQNTQHNHNTQKTPYNPPKRDNNSPASKGESSGDSRDGRRGANNGERQNGREAVRPKQNAPESSREQSHVKEQKGVDELRAILRSIVKEDSDKAESLDQKVQPTNNNQSKKTTPDPALKDVVAQALAVTNSQKSIVEPKPEAPVSPTPKLTEVAVPVVPEKVSSSAQSESTVKETDDPLSVKKLERMMRVTGNDRPPLL